MNNLIKIIIFIILAQGIAHAQFSRGKVMTGGNINYRSNSRLDTDRDVSSKDINRNEMFSMTLRAGILASESTAFGLLGSFNSQSSKTIYHGDAPIMNSQISTSRAIHVGVFGRRYMQLAESRFAFFGEALLSFGTGQSANENKSVDNTGTSNGGSSRGDFVELTASLLPGVAFIFSKNLILEAGLGQIRYNIRSSAALDNAGKPHNAQVTTAFEAGFSPGSLNLGIVFLFGGRETKK